MTNLFDSLACFYDLLYEDKETQKEVLYVKNLIDKFSNESTSVLDLGSGTGRHGIELAKLGYEIQGIEKSKRMVENANVFSGFSIIEGDIRSFKLKKKFDCAISLFHVMSYLNTNEDIIEVFENISTHLKKNGLFIFDYWYAPAVLNIRPTIKVKTLSNEDYIITRIAKPEILENLNMVIVNYDFLVENKKKNKLTKFSEKHPMRYFSLPEIENFANNAGFSILKSEQWLSGGRPSFNTWGVCTVLKKNG